jgi:hypothetical protein
MKKFIISCLIGALLLSGCNVPGREKPAPSATPDLVATEVQNMLTRLPTVTNPSATANTNTPAVATLVATSTPVPTFTPLPSFTTAPKETATTNPGDPASSLGKPTWTDTLNTAKNFYQDDNDNTQIKVSGGAVVMTSKTAIGWHGWTLTYAQPAADFYLQGLFKVEGCGGSDLYGLVFRADKENAGYFFGVTCDGKYNLYARDFNNNVMTKITDFTPNSAILTGSGQLNRLGVLTNADKISLYVNGTLLEEISDGTYSKGYFGPFIAGQTENFTSSMEEISLWKTN